MSRNQREGRYYGWVKGRHIRDFGATKVSPWRAFRKHIDRKYYGR